MEAATRSSIAQLRFAPTRIVEARYVAKGEYVLVLQRELPQLKLFTASGKFLDSASFPDHTTRQTQPQAISVNQDTALVWQQGRVTLWEIVNNRLVMRRELKVDERLFPLGASVGCGGHWLYARNDEQYEDTNSPLVDYIHRVSIGNEEVTIHTTFQDPRDPTRDWPWWDRDPGSASGDDKGLTIWHRSNPSSGGKILELDCSGSIVAEASETSLAIGDTVPVKAARPRPLEWNGGMTRTPHGTVVSVHRYFSHVQGADPHYWNNEFMYLVDGKFIGSVLVDRQWNILDYSPDTNMVLLSSFEPEYHFIQVSLQSLSNARSQ